MNVLQRIRRGDGGMAGMRPSLGMRSQMDRLFDRFFEPWMESEWLTTAGTWTPAMDVSEDDVEIVIRAELPGIDPKSIDVSVSDGALTIAGEKSEIKEEKEKDFYQCERRFGSFRRVIDLRGKIDPAKVIATFEHGVLTVRVSKPESVKPQHIEVKTTNGHTQPKRVAVGSM